MQWLILILLFFILAIVAIIFQKTFIRGMIGGDSVYNALGQFQDVILHTASKDLDDEVSKNVNLTFKEYGYNLRYEDYGCFMLCLKYAYAFDIEYLISAMIKCNCILYKYYEYINYSLSTYSKPISFKYRGVDLTYDGKNLYKNNRIINLIYNINNIQDIPIQLYYEMRNHYEHIFEQYIKKSLHHINKIVKYVHLYKNVYRNPICMTFIEAGNNTFGSKSHWFKFISSAINNELKSIENMLCVKFGDMNTNLLYFNVSFHYVVGYDTIMKDILNLLFNKIYMKAFNKYNFNVENGIISEYKEASDGDGVFYFNNHLVILGIDEEETHFEFNGRRDEKYSFNNGHFVKSLCEMISWLDYFGKIFNKDIFVCLRFSEYASTESITPRTNNLESCFIFKSRFPTIERIDDIRIINSMFSDRMK